MTSHRQSFDPVERVELSIFIECEGELKRRLLNVDDSFRDKGNGVEFNITSKDLVEVAQEAKKKIESVRELLKRSESI